MNAVRKPVCMHGCNVQCANKMQRILAGLRPYQGQRTRKTSSYPEGLPTHHTNKGAGVRAHTPFCQTQDSAKTSASYYQNKRKKQGACLLGEETNMTNQSARPAKAINFARASPWSLQPEKHAMCSKAVTGREDAKSRCQVTCSTAKTNNAQTCAGVLTANKQKGNLD